MQKNGRGQRGIRINLREHDETLSLLSLKDMHAPFCHYKYISLSSNLSTPNTHQNFLYYIKVQKKKKENPFTKKKKKREILPKFMMNLSFLLSFLSFAIIFSSSTISLAASDNMVLDVSVQQHIHTQCGYTRFPALCVETLTAGLASNNVNVVDIMSLLINKTLSESKLPVSNFEALSSHFISDEAQHARASIGTYLFPIA